jgi:hypothetical protein
MVSKKPSLLVMALGSGDDLLSVRTAWEVCTTHMGLLMSVVADPITGNWSSQYEEAHIIYWPATSPVKTDSNVFSPLPPFRELRIMPRDRS